MPWLDTKIHYNMLNKHDTEKNEIYGYEWGNPHKVPFLKAVVERFIKPHVDSQRVCLEIGPGGGRWTQFLLDFNIVYVVDYYPEIMEELKKNFARPNVITILNNGTDFPGVPDEEIDFLFTFGTFVHLEVSLINEYLMNMKRVLKKGGIAFIQYSDKRKKMAQENNGFSMNCPELMRTMVEMHGYTIIDEDTELIGHSSIILFKKM